MVATVLTFLGIMITAAFHMTLEFVPSLVACCAIYGLLQMTLE